MPINHLTDVLQPPNQPAVAFFTRGAQLRFVNGIPISTGSWVVDRDRIFVGITVLVYHRTRQANNIYRATCAAISRPIRGERRWRYRLQLQDSQHVGITHNNWKVCAETGSNPVRYFNA